MKNNRSTVLRLLICILILLTPVTGAGWLFAQERKIQNRPYLDDRVWHYGFLVGVHVQDLAIMNNGLAYVNQEGGLEYWYADVPEYTPGFSVGILGELKANEWLSVRLVPTMHFGDKKVVFKEQRSGKVTEQYLKSTLFSIPLDLKISALRFNNYRPYVVAGAAPTFDLTVKKGKELLVKPADLMLEIGMGLDLYYPFFKMIPELKFCFGLRDLFQQDRSDLKDPSLLKYTNSVSGVRSRMITLTLYFE
ncbi:MAG: PorT family protein [Bacteroidaceae bacterium]|nr:PorT family protein [Bacteroidaceae bacterium]